MRAIVGPVRASSPALFVWFYSCPFPRRLNPDRPAQAVAFEPRFPGIQKETVNLGILIERIPLESLQSGWVEVKHDRRGCFLERRAAPMPCRRWLCVGFGLSRGWLLYRLKLNRRIGNGGFS